MSDATARVRLLISDVDGTLVRHDKSLSEATVAAAKRLHAADIGFTLISARPPAGMRWIAERLGITRPMAAFNGGTIFDADGIVGTPARLDDHFARDVIARFGEAGITTWVFARGCWYATDTSDSHVDRERLSSGLEPIVKPDLASEAHEVDKIVGVTDDSGVLERLQEDIKAAAGDEAYVVMSQVYYLDVTATAANKGDGLTALSEAAGIPLDAIAVIGDQNNDIPMFERAGLSFAMGQASDHVRAAADKATRSNDDDGVAAVIDELLGGQKAG